MEHSYRLLVPLCMPYCHTAILNMRSQSSSIFSPLARARSIRSFITVFAFSLALPRVPADAIAVMRACTRPTWLCLRRLFSNCVADNSQNISRFRKILNEPPSARVWTLRHIFDQKSQFDLQFLQSIELAAKVTDLPAQPVD